MNKKEILYEKLGINSYELLTHTLKGEKGIIRTYYQVIWHTRTAGELKQDLDKTEYAVLLKELNDKEEL